MRLAVLPVLAALTFGGGDANAEAQKVLVPIAVWEARVSPIGSHAGYLTHTLGPKGTSIPLAGSSWTCTADAPAQYIDSEKQRYEAVFIECRVKETVIAALIRTACYPNSGQQSSQMMLTTGSRETGYILTLVCAPIPPPSSAPPKPVEKDL